MRKPAYTVIAVLVLFGSMAVAAQAQTSGRTKLIANVPFDFSAGNKKLPAGEYTVEQVSSVSDTVLQLRSKDSNASVLLRMSATIGKVEKNAKLIFNRYGDQYFFAQAWVDGDQNGLQAPITSFERAIARESTGNKVGQEAIALTRR
jgi:hypothetical protein